MKKLLKAVALATVLCMLLSTAAFAADLDSTYGSAGRVGETQCITASVENVGEGEQVVLLIVKAGVAPADAGENEIMFIDQKEATDGTAKFENILIKDVSETVDVYVGSAVTDGAQLVGKNISLADVATIKFVKAVDTGIVTADDSSSIAAALTVTVPEDLTIKKMIWALTAKKTGDTKGERFYSKAIDPDSASVEGNVQFAAAFKVDGFEEVYDIGALFLVVNADNEEETQFTHPDLDSQNGNNESEADTDVE